MDWFGKSTKVEGKNELESIGIRFQPIEFHPDRNEYELSIQLPGCPRDLVKLIYDKPSGKLKLQGKKRTTEFVHHFTVPTDCLATGIYGRFRGDVLRIIMPRLLSERPPSEGASSKQEDDDQKASSDPEATEQVGKEREKLPARLPESSRSDQKSTDKLREGGGKDRDNLPGRVPESTPSDQKSTDKLREGGGKDRKKLPARVPEPSPSDQKSTDKSTEGGRKDGDKSPAGVLLLPPPPPSDQETTEKFRQRDNELVPEITASQPSVRELRENYQKNISQNAAKPPPPPPVPPRGTAPAPWNRIKNKIISRKEEKEDREPSSDRNKAEQGDVEPEKSLVISQKKEVDTNAKIVAESEAKEKREEKKPSAGGKGTLWVVAKVKETGKAAVAAAMKEENRPVVVIGAAVLALVVIGASWRSSSKKTKN